MKGVELTYADGVGRHGFAGGRWWWVGGCAPVVAAFAAQTAVGVTGWLLGFVEAVADVGFGVIFLGPGQAGPELVEGMCLVSRLMHSPKLIPGGVSSAWIRAALLSSRDWSG